MNEYVIKNGKKLKTGYTTGSCAAAAAKAAAMMLMEKKEIEYVMLTLPSGEQISLEVEDISINESEVICAVRKDAGDDPDVTHGMKIYAAVKKTTGPNNISASEGVGRVTKEGLACKVGEPAINPVPLKMIDQSLKEAAEKYKYKEGFEVVLSAPEGEERAKNTFNGRLGIIGGISILGTTGIVEPMSEAAIIKTIKLEMDIRKKNEILFVAPGNYGLDFANRELGLDINLAVKCSNYFGEMFDHAVELGFKKILLVGHIGKLVKLAAGIMNTHSKTADGRNEIFAAHTAMNLIDTEAVRKIMEANTTDDIHQILLEYGVARNVYESILEKILFHINYRVKQKIQIEMAVFSNENGLLMQTENLNEYVKKVKELEL